MEHHNLHPLQCLSANTDKHQHGLVILNRPLQPQQSLLKTVWPKAKLKVTVDGGTNELYNNTGEEREMFMPDLITGDFDSIHPHVLQYYKEKNVEIIETPDQDYTDFTKCLQVLAEKKMTKQLDCVIVLGSFGGRLDQLFANIDTLFTAKTIIPELPVYLFSQESMACLLSQGKYVIHTSSPYRGDWCGLIPVGASCECVTTTGLKWNLDKQRLRFGELISTSNTWDSESGVVTIETDQPLLWTMGLKLPS